MAEAFEVRTYREADAPGVLGLLGSAFGAWPGPRVAAHDRSAEFFRWKHASSPRGRSFILLAEADGRLIGMRAYMRWPLRADGRLVPAVQAVDLATHPDYQGRGVNSALTKRAIEILSETGPLSLGLPNERSRSQSRKVGWRPVGKLPVWVRVRRPLHVLSGARSLRSPARSLTPPPVDAVAAADCLTDGAGVTELLGADSDAGARFSTDGGVDYLRWRYEPFLADYRAVTEHEAGRLSGLAIFRLRQRGWLWEGTVCELLVRPGDHRTAARLLRQVTRAAPLDYLAAVPVAGSSQARTLARVGFVRSPVGAATLGVTPYRAVTPDPFRRDSWALSLGDLERLQLC